MQETLCSLQHRFQIVHIMFRSEDTANNHVKFAVIYGTTGLHIVPMQSTITEIHNGGQPANLNKINCKTERLFTRT